jgi:hypothetical protein
MLLTNNSLRRPHPIRGVGCDNPQLRARQKTLRNRDNRRYAEQTRMAVRHRDVEYRHV